MHLFLFDYCLNISLSLVFVSARLFKVILPLLTFALFFECAENGQGQGSSQGRGLAISYPFLGRRGRTYNRTCFLFLHTALCLIEVVSLEHLEPVLNGFRNFLSRLHDPTF